MKISFGCVNYCEKMLRLPLFESAAYPDSPLNTDVSSLKAYIK